MLTFQFYQFFLFTSGFHLINTEFVDMPVILENNCDEVVLYVTLT